MKRIDALLRRAKQIETDLFPCVSLLRQEVDGFKLSCNLWDGKANGVRRTIETEHNSAAEARTAYSMFLHKYPASRKCEPVLIDMIMMTEGGGDDGEASLAIGHTESG